ncbi:MAG: glycosyltransferase [Oscillatoria sp. PMC 1068.18]|nr:glycosyltransferase [Oscillatoria sp. PMC 1068.18]
MINQLSVIVPVYNCAEVVTKTLDSIIASVNFFQQNYPQAAQVKSEIIVVNDASTDNTLDILNKLVSNNYPLKIITHNTNKGAGAARNTGVNNSQGEILFFCDGDDLFYPHHIYVCFLLLNHQPQPGNKIYLKLQINQNNYTIPLPEKPIDAIKTGVRIKDKIHPNWRKPIENSLTINTCIRRQCHEFIGGFPEDEVYKKIRGGEDCSYYRYLFKFFKIGAINLETVEYVRYPGNSFDKQLEKYQFPPGEYHESRSTEETSWFTEVDQLEQKQLAHLTEKRKQLAKNQQEWQQNYEADCQSKGYQFTQDWFSLNIPLWEQVFKQFAHQPDLNFLEIGSWEGRSTCWLLDRILTHKSAKITCLDTFEGSVEHKSWYEQGYIASLEGRFDHNIAQTKASEKVKKIVGYSQEILRTLPTNAYNFIYIDGSHLAPDVLEDAALSWRLLKQGGIIIFDDYNVTFSPNPTESAKLGIDAFTATFRDKIKLIHKGHQVVVKKIAS